MSIEQPSNPFAHHSPHPVRRNPNPIWWILGGGLFLGVLCCGGIIAALAYVGIAGPETSVYTGNQVPARFIQTAREVGALDADETVRFFYSDSLIDIREGFYFVSDRKVAIYIDDGRESPLTAIEFNQIANVEIFRDESFFDDSQITIETTDGDFFAFPVSSEFDRDQHFFDAIETKHAAHE